MTRADGSTLQEKRLEASLQSGGTSDSAIYSAVERALARHSAAGDALDFGAGKGALTARLRRSGRFDRVTGVDLMGRPPDLADDVEWAAQDLNATLSFEDRSLDVVVAAEIIEHLENPRAVAREWFHVL